MSYTQTTTFADPTVTKATLQTELDNIRTALNGNVDAADVSANSVESAAIAQPVIAAFPGTLSGNTVLARYAADEVRHDPQSWRWRRERRDVFPQASLDDNDQQVIMGRTVYVRAGESLQVNAHASFNVAYNYVSAATYYDTMHCGSIALYYRLRAIGYGRTRFTGCRRQLWSDITNYSAGTPSIYQQRGQLWMIGDLSVSIAGWYDVLMIYEGGSADSNLLMVGVGHRGMLVSVQPNQNAQG